MLPKIVLSLVFFGGLVSAQLALNGPTCGVKGPHSSGELGIVGGDDASPFEFPWQGALTFTVGDHYSLCGASILNNRWIITASHCVIDDKTHQMKDLTKFEFISGSLKYRGHTDQPRTVSHIEKGFAHPNYDIPRHWNDVALMKLKDDLPLPNPNSHLAPICLPKERPPNNLDYLAGVVCTITGWGDTTQGGNTSEILQFANVTIVKQTSCNANVPIINGMICAAAPGKDSCQGDSGGPFVCYLDGKWNLVGVTSFGVGCAQPKFPGVYARITEYLPWIKETIANN